MSNKNPDRLRRALVKGAGFAGAAAVISACDGGGQPNAQDSPSKTRASRSLKMVTTWPKNFPGVGTGAERFARTVETLSEGSISIRVFAAGELVPALGAFDAVSEGKADMYHGPEYYWQGKSKAFNFFTSVPFGMTAEELVGWIEFGGGQELWDELSAQYQIKAVVAGNTSPQMGGWFRSEIKSLEDFKGLRMRIPGLGGEVLKRMGATPVTKAGGEIYLALSQGNIDAAEWVGAWNDMAFGFHDIAKFYYYPGFHEPGPALAAGVNLDIWNDMDDWEKEVIRAAGRAESTLMNSEFVIQNSRALTTLVNEHGVKVLPYPDDVVAEMARLSQQVLEESAAEDDLTRRVYESYMTAKRDLWGLSDVSMHAYLDARKRTSLTTTEGS